MQASHVAAAVAFGICLTSGQGAQAQSDPTSLQSPAIQDAATGIQPSAPAAPVTLPGSTPPRSSARTLLNVPLVSKAAAVGGPLSSVSDALLDEGISFHLLFAEAAVFSGSAGIDPNRAGTSGFIVPSLDFDLAKSIGLEGGHVHLSESIFVLRSGTGLPSAFTRQIGDTLISGSFQNNPRSNEFSLATYEQDFINGGLQFEGGRTNMFRYFALPNSGNFIFGNDPVLEYDAQILPPPFASWGGRTSYVFPNKVYIQAGAAEVDQAQIGKHGFDWTTGGATGGLGMAEVGYKRFFNSTRYPTNDELGVFYDSSKFSDPRSALPARFGQFDAGTSRRDAGLFFKATQTVWNPGAPLQAGRHLDAFATATLSFDDNQPFSNFWSVGMTLYGPIASRPQDTVGFEIARLTTSSKWRQFELDSRELAGGGAVPVSPTENRFSIYSQFGVTPYAVLQPTVGYIVNPDAYGSIGDAHAPRDGVFASLTLLVFLGTALGFPPPGP